MVFMRMYRIYSIYSAYEVYLKFSKQQVLADNSATQVDSGRQTILDH